jgi:hypothetical protein
MASFNVYAGNTFFFFFKHLCTASSATEAITTATLHFYQFGIQRFQNNSGGFVNIIGTAKIAAIMIRNAFTFKNTVFF